MLILRCPIRHFQHSYFNQSTKHIKNLLILFYKLIELKGWRGVCKPGLELGIEVFLTKFEV